MALNALLAHGWFGVLLLTALGLAVGSFLNVVVHRLPIMLDRVWERQVREWARRAGDEGGVETGADFAGVSEAPFNLLTPRSHCRACGHRIRVAENIPILSWLMLRGRCSDCGAAIGVRYPIVEALGACAALVSVGVFGWSWLAFAAACFACFLIALACIDFDTRLLPDELTLPLLWCGLLTNALGGFTDIAAAVLGAACGYLFLWSVYWSFKLLTRKEGMGYGDFKLLAAIGAWLGWTALPTVILIAAATAIVYALARMALRQWQSGEPLPFGPFLALAGWVVLIGGEQALIAMPVIR